MLDLRFAFRQLLKAPVVTTIAILALALGIGVNTAIFSLVYGVLLRPLPFPNQEELVFLSEWSEQVPGMSVSYPNYVDLRARQQSFSSLGAARSQGFSYVGSTETELLNGATASADTFVALGVPPLRGRFYRVDEDKPGAERTVVISERLWQRLFGGRAEAIGERINLSGEVYSIIGVAAESFQYPNQATDVWVPLGLFADRFSVRGNHPGITCVGRLNRGVTIERATIDLKGIAENLAREYPNSNAHQSVALQPLTERVFSQLRPALIVLLAAAGCVLLIACANVANLQLARAHARSREFAVRSALGAGRSRVVRLLLIESLLLGAGGCLVGLAFGYGGLAALKSILPPNLPRVADVTLNGGVLTFALVVSLGTSLLFGLVPAVQATRQDLREAMNQGARGSAAGGHRWRAALIIGEFSLTSLLLLGAGLMLRTMFNLYQADPGFSTEHVVAGNWLLAGQAYTDEGMRAQKLTAALARLRDLPGVKSVALVNPIPLNGGGNQNSYRIEEKPDPEVGRGPSAEFGQVSEDYFKTMGIRLVEGRTFGPDDRSGTHQVAVVDTVFAEKNFGRGVSPLGKRMVFGDRPTKQELWIEIIGVVAHIQNYGLGQVTREQTYMPFTQRPPSSLSFVLRTDQDPALLGQSMRKAVREIAPDAPIFSIRTMNDYFERSIGTQRLTVMLLGAFAALALLLASLGLYGVLSYTVGQRTREIGVRMALGAQPSSVVKLVLQYGAKLAGLGLVVGSIVALGAGQLLKTILYQVSPFDPLSFVLVALVLSTIGLLACWAPARSATRINPIEALRAD